MTNLLTLSISETWKDNYKVVTFDLDQKKFVSLEIHESQFIDQDGNIIWDLFGVTKINQIQSTIGEFSIPIGTPVLQRYFEKTEMIQFFNNNKTTARRFFFGIDDYGIIEVDSINQIYLPERKNGKLSQKLDFISGGKKYSYKLNKDFRWINYWNQIPERKYYKKIDQWTNYLNKENNSIYLVVYQHKPFKNPIFNKWIVGFHCL